MEKRMVLRHFVWVPTIEPTEFREKRTEDSSIPLATIHEEPEESCDMKSLPEPYKDPVQNCTSTSTSFAPSRMASLTAAWSFIRKMRHSEVSI